DSPEITTVVDVATGRVVGWSAWEKECAWAVIDALRQAILLGGVPCIFYSDNGPGYVNGRMDALKSRLGFKHHTGIPYNSQARGVIERLQKTLWVELGAKSFGTYVGAAMDREARQIVFKATRKGVPVLPPWQNFVTFMEHCVEAYNARPSKACPKGLDADGRKRHLSPAEHWQQLETLGWKPEGLPLSLDDFRPEEIRTVLRGEINLFGNRYFSRELAELHKDQVRVAFDIHDATRIWVRSMEGELICEAGFQANSCAYFPKPYVEQLREQRKDGQRKRLEAKAERVLGPMEPVEIEELSPQALENSARQLQKLGVVDADPEAPEPRPEPAVERPRPRFADGREYALWILDHPDQADPEELEEINRKLRKDPLYRDWLGRDGAVPA
ncbi:MAG TPA: transposase family protein, partial [Holophaga sp.]|nr:transposase family protein [Holophaga sp.]